MPHTESAGASAPGANAYRRALGALRGALGGVMLFSAIINVLMLTGSIYMLQVYDRVLSSGSVPTLMVLFAIVVVLFGFLGLYDFLRARLLSRAALRLDDALGGATFRRWLDTGLSDAAAPDDAHAMRDLDTVRGFLSGPAVAALADLPFVPLFLAVLFAIHPWIGLLTIAGAGVGGTIALANRMLTRDAIRDGATLDLAERNFADRARRNADIARAMGMTGAITDRWRRLHRASLARGQQGSDPSEVLAATSRAFRMLLQSAILTLGAFLVLRGEISAGMIVAGSILSGRALAPVDQLIGQWRAAERCSAAHKRLIAAFDRPDADPDRIDLPTPTGRIAVAGLTRLGGARPGGERPKILADVGFALEPGDGLGVIGSSASGKSTLARLLVGAGRADSGEIRLDGATLDQWRPERLGRHIGYLPQTLDMLPGTIRDNIARFDPEAADATVIAAARLAGIHEMILKLPDGYATRLGDPGRPPPLSGGQMQRLGLARAVHGLPGLIVLDEPNANLDLGGDAALTETIRTLRAAGSTVIVMAHRPSVLMAVNKLMILEAGTVRVFGDRDDILSADCKVVRTTPAETAPRPSDVLGGTPGDAWDGALGDTIGDTAGGAAAARDPAPGARDAAAAPRDPNPATSRIYRFARAADAPAVVRQAGPAHGKRPA